MNGFLHGATVPVEWRFAGLTKFLSSIVDYRGATPEKVSEGVFLVTAGNIRDGRIDYDASQEFIAAADYEQVMRRGKPLMDDLLFTTEAPLGQVALVDREGIALAQRVIKLRPKTDHLDHRFLLWWMQSEPFQFNLATWATGSTAVGIKAEKLHKLRIALPPLDEQRRIAAFLDRETARLDELVAAKERLLGLLAEKRRALITSAVTRGLDPSAPLRDSGLPWLREIPAHWRTERTKWILPERDERTENDDGEMLTVSHLTGVTPRSQKDVNMFEAETTEGYKICRRGDLAINTLWAWMGAMGVAPCDGIVSPAYNVYVPTGDLEPGYVDALVRLPTFAQEVTRFSKGVWSSRLRLYPEGLYEVWLPVPPLVEQRAIVAHIAAATAKLDDLRAAAERTLALLRERRAALIAAAVTGKLGAGQ